MEMIKKHKYIILVSLSFTILYSLISIVNHYCFKTDALDLGLYTNAAYKYAHFQVGDSSMIKEYFEPILGGHFDLYLIVFSPLTYLFGTYSLLIVQIIALIIGGIGVYRYFYLFGKKNIPLYASIYFFLFFGVYSALSFDYHSVVVASCIVPWFFIAISNNKKVLSVILLIFMLVSQENISLWVFFICLGLAIEHRKNIKKVTLLLLFSGISITYYIVITSYFIPSISAQNVYGGFQYSYFGDNLFSAIKTVLTQPIESVKVLFTNHTNSPYGNMVKIKLHIILFASGLPLLIIKPHYIVMILPIFFQKLFHDNFMMWGTDFQYNIEFTPILAIGIFSVISEFKRVKFREILSLSVLLFVLISTRLTMNDTISFIDKSKVRFYEREHYYGNYNLKSVYQLFSELPKNAKISAQSAFVPHLSLRDNIYLFPIIKDAEYIIYSKKENIYPMSNDEFEMKINELENSQDWEIYYSKEITILKKISL